MSRKNVFGDYIDYDYIDYIVEPNVAIVKPYVDSYVKPYVDPYVDSYVDPYLDPYEVEKTFTYDNYYVLIIKTLGEAIQANKGPLNKKLTELLEWTEKNFENHYNDLKDKVDDYRIIENENIDEEIKRNVLVHGVWRVMEEEKEREREVILKTHINELKKWCNKKKFQYNLFRVKRQNTACSGVKTSFDESYLNEIIIASYYYLIDSLNRTKTYTRKYLYNNALYNYLLNKKKNPGYIDKFIQESGIEKEYIYSGDINIFKSSAKLKKKITPSDNQNDILPENYKILFFLILQQNFINSNINSNVNFGGFRKRRTTKSQKHVHLKI